jgi:hypothetical protein
MDWIPGQKNENGVYCPTEVLRMERNVKGWRGVARVEIDLVQTDVGWRAARGFSFFTGSHWGAFGPIDDHCTPHPTREAAIAEQVARMRREWSKLDEPSMQREASEMLAWLDSLNPAQLDLFAA